MKDSNHNLDDLFREALKDEQMPFESSEWDKLESQLDQKMPVSSPNNTLKWIVGSGIAAAIIIGGAFMYNYNVQTEENIDKQKIANNQEIDSDAISNHENTSNKNEIVDEKVEKDEHLPINNQVKSEVTPSNINDSNSDESSDEKEFKKIESLQHEGDLTTINSSTEENLPNVNIPQEDKSKDNTVLELEVEIDSKSICLGDKIKASVTNVDAFEKISWVFNEKVVSNEKGISYEPKDEGTHSLTIVGLKDNNKIEKNLRIEVLSNPTPIISWKEKNPGSSEIEFSHNLEVETSQWMIDEKEIQADYSNSVLVKLKGQGAYLVNLNVAHNNGCKNSTEESIYITDDFQLLAPNAFTPNGDGINDYFMPKSLEIMNQGFTMIIYDRSGQVIFQTNTLDRPWDGTNMRTGKQAPQGSYVWTVKLSEKQQTYQGVISLLK